MLHSGNGIVGTSFQAIAEQAGTAQATVYRHFPSLEELLPACANTVTVLQQLTPEHIEEIFGGLRSPGDRLRVLILGTCDCYRRDGGWLSAARGEANLIPALRHIARVQTGNLRVLVDAALEGTHVDERTRRRIAALTDFPVWQALKAAGFDDSEATKEMLQLVREQLLKSGM